MSQETATFEGWCILELMGHRCLAGYVTEQEIEGGDDDDNPTDDIPF